MGVVYAIIGTFLSFAASDWVYGRLRGTNPRGSRREILAAVACGGVASVVAAAFYVPAGIHSLLFGAEVRWPASVFLGVCLGIFQGVLYRGERFVPVKKPDTPGP